MDNGGLQSLVSARMTALPGRVRFESNPGDRSPLRQHFDPTPVDDLGEFSIMDDSPFEYDLGGVFIGDIGPDPLRSLDPSVND